MANLYKPAAYNHFVLKEAVLFLEDIGDPDLQDDLEAVLRGIASRFPAKAQMGIEGARELFAALLIKGVL